VGSSHPFRHKNPGFREVKKRMDSRDVSLTAIFTGLYAILVIVLAPISSGPIQLRVADCLIPLAALFGWPVVAGVTIGSFLGNAYGWLGPYDVIFGPIANLIAASVILLLRRQRLLACVLGALPIGVIVGGGYLWLYFPPPDIFGLSLPEWAAMMASITISSLIATAVIGYSLLTVLSRPSIIEPLKSRGLKVVTES
jgi:predicted membrane protein